MNDNTGARSVVVTGASSGIGLAIALGFAREGARVVLAARSPETLTDAAAQCQALGAEVLAVPTDVGDGAQVDALGLRAVAAFGGIDVWVNCAGTSLWGRFEDIPRESHAQLLATNLLGVIHGSHAAVRHMLARGGRGVLINVSSFAGRVPIPFAATYSASKFGVSGFTDALRDELGTRSQVAVCGVYPAFADTPTNERSANYTGHSLRAIPPVLDPQRVARSVVELAHRPRRASYIGVQHLATVPYAVAPDTTGRVAAHLNDRFFLRSGAPAPANDGALFTPRPLPAAVTGDWRAPAQVVAGVATAVGVLASAGLWAAARLLRRR